MTAPADPIELFRTWLADAEAGEPNDPTAVALATADSRGRHRGPQEDPRLIDFEVG